MNEANVGIRITAVDDTKTAFGSINNGLAGIGNAAAGVSSSLAALGIGISAGAFVAFAKNIINGIDALNDLKDATGASIENISALEDVALRTGTSLDTVGTSLVKLNQALANAKPGSDAERAFTALGLSVKDLKALDPAEAFRQIAVELNKFADDGNKARLTQELFGKSLKEVAPLLKDVAEQGALVATVTTEQAEAAEKFNKELFALEKTTTDLSRAFVTKLLPSLNALAAEMAAAQKTSRGFWDGFITQALQNPFKSAGENAAKYREELDDLNAARKRYIQSGSDTLAIDQAIATMQRRLAYFTELEGNATARAAAAGGGRGFVNPLLPKNSVGDLGSGPDKAAQAAALAQQKQFLAERLRLSRQAVIDEGDAVKEANEAFQKAAAKNYEQLLAAQVAAATASNKELFALREANEAQRLQNETIGLTTEQMNELVLKRMDLTIATQEGVVAEYADIEAMDALNGTRNANIEVMQREIDKLNELKKARGLAADGQTKNAAFEQIKKTEAEAKKLGEQLENIISDGLMRGFENGKTFAENFRDTLTNVFKTMVLRPVIEATVRGGLGLDGGSGGISGGIGGFVDGLAKAGKAFESLSLAATDFKTFAGNQAYELGGALTNAGFDKAGSAVTKYAGKFGEYAKTAGEVLGYLEAASNFKDGSYGKSIGQGIGLYFSGGNPIFGQIGKEIGSAIDKIFGGGGPVAYGVNTTFDAKGNRISAAAPSGFTASDGLDALNQALANNFAALLTKFGSTVGSVNFQSQSYDGGSKVGASVNGQQVFASGDRRLSNDELQLASSRAIFAALQASELPGYLSKAFTGIVANTASAEQISGALQFADSLKSIRFGLLSATEQQAEYQKIIDAGTASLKTSAATFNKDFIAAIDAGLTPETLAQWNALGTTMQALEQITGKTNSTLRSAADIANERKRLQDELNGLTLTNTQLLAAQRTALDESNRALFDQVQALKAESAVKEAATNLNSARNAVTSALNAVAATVRGFAQAYADAQQGVETVRRQIFDQSLQAQNNVAAAQARVNDLLRASVDRLKNFSQSIDGFLESLNGGQGESTQSLKARLSSTAVLAQGGDAAAQGKLLSIAQSVVDASRNSSKSAVDFARDQAFVRNTLLDVQKSVAGEIGKINVPDAQDPLAGAQADLLKAQKEAADLQLVAAAAGVNTAQTQASAAAQLLSAFSSALAVSDAAKLNFDAAKSLTAGLGAGSTSSLAGLAEQILNLGTANAGLTKAQDEYNIALLASGISADKLGTALGITDDAAKALATRLGLSGDAAVAFVKAITDPVTGTQALSTALGLPNTNAAALATQLGLSGTAASNFVTKIGEIGKDLDTKKFDISKLQTALDGAGITFSDFVRLVGGTQSTSVASIITAFGSTLGTSKKTLNDAADEIATSVKTAASQISAQPFSDALTAAAAGLSFSPITGAITSGASDIAGALAALKASLTVSSVVTTPVTTPTTGGFTGDTLDELIAYLQAEGNPLFQNLPRFAVGTNYVPNDMIAMLHKGEAVVPAAYNPMQGGGGLDAKFEALRAEISALRAEQIAGQSAIASSTQKTAKVLEKWDVDGQPAVAV